MMNSEFSDYKKQSTRETLKFLVFSTEANYRENLIIYIIWLAISSLDELLMNNDELKYYIKERLLSRSVHKILDRLGRGESDESQKTTLIKILMEFDNKLFGKGFDIREFVSLKSQHEISDYISSKKSKFIKELFSDDYVKLYLNVNYHEDVWYYSKEMYEELAEWILNISLINYLSPESVNKSLVKKLVSKLFMVNKYLLDSSGQSGFQLEKLEAILLHSN